MQRGFGYQNRRNAGFNPATLFAGTVNGTWYDPSDSTTLFSDRAGTTPCGTPGGGSVVPVGLMLDKSQGLVLGSELVTNGGPFTATTGWTAGSGGTLSVSSQNLRITNGIADGADAVFSASAPTAGKWYKVQFTIVARTTSYTARFFFGGNSITGLNAGSYTYYLRATTTGAFTLSNGAVGVIGEFADYNNISVRELAGNHAIAANDTTARPELRARVNLLTYSEQFDNAAWVKGNVGGDITLTTGQQDPLGGTTATSFQLNVASNNFIYQTPGTLGGAVYTASCYLKQGTARYGYIILVIGANRYAVLIDLQTGSFISEHNTPTPLSSKSYSISPAGNGYWRLSVSGANTGGGIGYIVVEQSTTSAITVTPTTIDITNSGTGQTILIWGAQLTATNQFPANTYQRISDANTYDAVGFPRYLAFNGTSSAMSTPGNVNLSGTDKATVFAGVRKNSAAGGTFVELSPNSDLNNGSFVLYTVTDKYGFQARGTTAAYYEPQTYTAPISNTLTMVLDIAGATLADEITPRVNGIVDRDNPFNGLGTGNFGTYPLFIGARNNASSFLNGNIYSLIVVGSAVSAGQISATEQWVAQRTGITI